MLNFVSISNNLKSSREKVIKEIETLKSYVEFKKRRSIHFKNKRDYLQGIFFLKNKSILDLKKDISKINYFLYNFNDGDKG